MGYWKGLGRYLSLNLCMRLSIDVSYFKNHRVKIGARIPNVDMYTTYVMTKVTNYEAKVSGHSIRIFDRETEMFNVTIAVRAENLSPARASQTNSKLGLD